MMAKTKHEQLTETIEALVKSGHFDSRAEAAQALRGALGSPCGPMQSSAEGSHACRWSSLTARLSRQLSPRKRVPALDSRNCQPLRRQQQRRRVDGNEPAARSLGSQ